MKFSRIHPSLLALVILVGCTEEPKKDAATRAREEAIRNADEVSRIESMRCVELRRERELIRLEIREWEKEHSPVKECLRARGLEKKSDLGPIEVR